jgi:hypothetical protein
VALAVMMRIVALNKVVTVSNVLWLALLTMTVLTRRCKFFTSYAKHWQFSQHL